MFAVWVVSVVATLGSLFFSDVMGLPPCVLCWYQRVCMYPLVVIATVALITRDRRATRYAWPFGIAGLVVSSYHSLLYYAVLPANIAPCATGVSCTERKIEWFGVVTIPLLSVAAFVSIVGCLLWCGVRLREVGHDQ